MRYFDWFFSTLGGLYVLFVIIRTPAVLRTMSWPSRPELLVHSIAAILVTLIFLAYLSYQYWALARAKRNLREQKRLFELELQRCGRFAERQKQQRRR